MEESTKEFTEVESFLARLGPTDRFLSIYNRPTRMRQIFMRPEDKVPSSGIVKHVPSGEIYLVGIARNDSRWNVAEDKPYVSIVMAHLVTPNKSGTIGEALVLRKVLPTEDIPGRHMYIGDDGILYGWLEENIVYDTYADVEFRTTKSEPGTVGERIGDYYAWLPSPVELKVRDKIIIDDTTYFVTAEYTDLGFSGASLSEEQETMFNFHYVSTESSFIPGQGMITEEVLREVTGKIPSDEEKVGWASGIASHIDVAIYVEHIGIVPKIDDFISYEGRKRRIKTVSLQATKKQYLIRCE